MPTYENELQRNPSTGRPQPNATERLSVRGALNQPMVCTECGSTYFLSGQAEQFAAGGHGSAEFRGLSLSPMPIKICLCGAVNAPSVQSQGGAASIQQARKDFYLSIEAVKKFRKNNTPSAIVADVPNRKEMKDVLELVSQLQKKVETLEQQLQQAKVDREPAPAPTTKKKASKQPVTDAS